MSISPELNKYHPNSSIYPGYLEINKSESLAVNKAEIEEIVASKLIDHTDLEEDRLLNFLISKGVIDHEWRLTAEYRDIEIDEMKVDQELCTNLLRTAIYPCQQHNDFNFQFLELLYFAYIAGSQTRDAIAEFAIHGSFASHLVGLNSLKQKLLHHFPEIKELLSPINPRFTYSDIDLKIKAGVDKKMKVPHFTDRLSNKIAGKFIENLHYEISESIGESRQVRGYNFETFLERLNRTQLNFSITDIRIYRRNSPQEIAHYNQEKNLIEFSEILFLASQPNKLKVHLVRKFAKSQIAFEFARSIFIVDRSGQQLLVEGETIKLMSSELEIDLFYKREGIAEESRMEHQKLSVDLLPLFQQNGSFRVKGSFQTVLDLVCGIGHWIKKENDSDDWSAYLFMITRGLRFPNNETAQKLKTICEHQFGTNRERLKNHLIGFKKLAEQSNDFKALFMLNACKALDSDAKTQQKFLSGIVPESESLKALLQLLTNGRMSIKTAQAIMTIVAYRALMMSVTEREKLPFDVQITRNEGESVFKLSFNRASISVGTNLSKAWKEICSYGVVGDQEQNDLVELIKCLGGFRYLCFENKSRIERNFANNLELIELTSEQLMESYVEGNPVLKRIAAYLVMSRIALNHDIDAIVLLFTKFNDFRKDGTALNLLKDFENHLAKRDRLVYKRCLETLFNDHFSNAKDLMHDLIFFENEIIFKTGLALLQENPLSIRVKICFEAAKEHIHRNRAGKAMALLELLAKHRHGTQENWQPILNEIISILSKSKNRPEDIAVAQGRIVRLCHILTSTLPRLKVSDEFINDWSALRLLISYIQHDEISTELNHCLEEILERTTESKFQEQIVQMEKIPSLDLARVLLEKAAERPQLIRSIFITYLERHFNKSEILRSLPTLLEILKNDQFQELFRKAGPQTKLMTLLDPILKQLFSGNEHFEFIGTILGIDYNYSKEHYIQFLKMALSLPSTAEGEVQFNRVKHRLKSLLLSHEESANLILIETAFELKRFNSGEEALKEYLIKQTAVIVEGVEKLVRPQKQTLIFDFYKLIMELVKNRQSIRNSFEAVMMIRNLIELRSYSKEQQIKIKEFDGYLFQLILQNYEAHHHDSAIELMIQFLENKQLTKTELSSLKVPLSKIVRNVPEVEEPLKCFMNDLFDQLCNNMGHNANYNAILEAWIGSESSNYYLNQLINRLDNLDAAYKNTPIKTLPPRLLKHIHTVLDVTEYWRDLKNISNILNQPAFVKFVDSETYNKLMQRYFTVIAFIIFSNDGPFKEAMEEVWSTLHANLELNFVKRKTKEIKHPLDPTHEKWLENRMQMLPIRSSASGIAYSLVFAVNEILLKLYKPRPGSLNDSNKIWNEPLEYLEMRSEAFESIMFMQEQTKNLSQKNLLLLLETIVTIQPTGEALVATRNAFVIHLIKLVKDPTDPEFLRILDLYIYQDQRELRNLGVDCHYYPLRDWFESCGQKSLFGKLNLQLRLEREIEYKSMILGPDERFLQYQSVSRTLLKVLEKMKEKGICYHSMLTSNLFNNIQNHVDIHHNLLYMFEIEGALTKCNPHRVSAEYYYLHCINLITASKNFLISLRNGSIKLIDFDEVGKVEIIYDIIKNTLPLLEKNAAALFSIKTELATLLMMLPDDLKHLIQINKNSLHEILYQTDTEFRERVEKCDQDTSKKLQLCLDYFKLLKKYITAIENSHSTVIKAELADDILIIWSTIYTMLLELVPLFNSQSQKLNAVINACSAVAFCLQRQYFEGQERIYLDSIDGLLCLMSELFGDLMHNTEIDGVFTEVIFNIFINYPHNIYKNTGLAKCKPLIFRSLGIIEMHCYPLYQRFIRKIYQEHHELFEN